MIICRYCEIFYRSPVINEKGNVQRHCEIIEDNVSTNSKACRKFKPSSGYWCVELNFRTCLEICLNRRRNKKSYDAWNYCCKCRQFAKEIQPIVDRYMERKIKRKDSDNPFGWKRRERVITRRDLKSIAQEEVRKIRRRNKKRKIRRR